MMIVCRECGCELPDQAKFCKNCGANVQQEVSNTLCPSCGKNFSAEFKFCPHCGAKIETDTYVVCPTCGKEAGKDSRFCLECGSNIQDVERSVRFVVAGNSIQEHERDKCSNRAKKNRANVKNKVAQFERNTHIIYNAFIAVLSLMFVIFALFMPIRIVSYDSENFVYTLGADDVYKLASLNFDSGEEEIKLACHPVAVKQSLWKLFGAIGYVSLDPNEDTASQKKYDAIMSKFELAVQEAENEAFDKYAVRNSITGAYSVPTFKLEAYMRAYEKALEKRLSKINYLGYLLANDYYEINGFGAVTSGNPGAYAIDCATLIMTIIVAVISFAFAAMALVWLTLAIIGLVRKKKTLKCDRMLFIAALISGVGLILSIMTPGGKSCLGMLVGLITTVAASVVMSISHALSGNVKIGALIKRVVLVGLCTTCLLLLCTNAMAISGFIKLKTFAGPNQKSESATISLKIAAPIGAFLAEALDIFVSASTGINSEIDLNNTGVAICGIASYVLALGVLVTMLIALLGSIKVASSNSDSVRLQKYMSLLATILTLVLIIFTGGISRIISNSLSEPISTGTISDLLSGIGTVEIAEWFLMRTQAYFAMFISLGAFLISLFLFRKKEGGKIKRGDAESSTKQVPGQESNLSRE